jgi:RND family efflux transporter MFP subunit
MNLPLRWMLSALAGLVMATAGMLALACGDDSAGGPDALKHKEVTAERGPFRVAVTASGLVRPIDRIELKSKASGEVTKLPIEVGDRVEEGALVAQLDQVEEKAALAQAEADLVIARAELALAEKNFERRQQLFSSNVISKEQQDETELELAVARSRLVQATTSLERAHERMEDTVISAPVAGVILQKYVERGQIIASGVSNVGGGTPIADIADMRKVQIEAGVDEIDIGKIEVGQTASVQAEAYPEHAYQGQVVRIAPEARVEQNVTLFDVIVEVGNTDGNLKSQMNASVEIVIENRPDVLTIPVAALQEDGSADPGAPDRTRVLVKENGDYVSREIRTGASDYRVVEVLDGLEEGAVLGIPMTSRLKQDNDLLDSRVRSSRTFGKKKTPSPGG